MTSWRARSLTGWITLLVFTLAALAPSVSRALAPAGSPGPGSAPWVEVCGSEGVRPLALDEAGADLASDVAGQSLPATIDLDHCELCILLAHGLAPPLAGSTSLVVPRKALARNRSVSPRARRAAYGTALARGPPEPFVIFLRTV